MPAGDRVSSVLEDLRGARKYAGITDTALARTAAWALERSSDPRQAAKLAKRKLHQAHGAFFSRNGIRDAERAVERLSAADLQRTCRSVLACHASTRERMPYMDEFFAAVFGDLAGPLRVVDLACGLTPFSIPWMPLAAGTSYVAIDFDLQIEGLARRLAPFLPVRLEPSTSDLVSEPPRLAADVALLLKAVPTLEQEETGAAVRVLENVEAPRVAISVSAHTLAGRRKGMRRHYERMLDPMLPGGVSATERFDFASETLFLITRDARAQR
jgi:16S rRNA (guanine(1405)-N(7))-methyltransferase